jgi:Zn-dependent M28 family amino/carboxypeptidase
VKPLAYSIANCRRKPAAVLILALLALVALVACSGGSDNSTPEQASPTDAASQAGTAAASAADTQQPELAGPPFEADSAYAYIEKQLAFGPRVPNTAAHKRCAHWLVRKFEQFGAQVEVQQAQVRHHTGRLLNIKNIIASYNPQAQRRIMLSAHWDTRPLAEKAANPQRRDEPIPGANDGASGVAVLLEIARQLEKKAPNVGVDIFLWDAEDWGESGSRISETWCLGSQHWAQNPHKPGYSAAYGINLDMVGAKNATFLQEGYSRRYAQNIVDHVWSTAHALGHGDYFLFQREQTLTDDHYYINTMANIPMIDIIHTQPGRGLFFQHWHTHQDTIDKISRQTLQAVGETVLQVVYEEKPA